MSCQETHEAGKLLRPAEPADRNLPLIRASTRSGMVPSMSVAMNPGAGAGPVDGDPGVVHEDVGAAVLINDVHDAPPVIGQAEVALRGPDARVPPVTRAARPQTMRASSRCVDCIAVIIKILSSRRQSWP